MLILFTEGAASYRCGSHRRRLNFKVEGSFKAKLNVANEGIYYIIYLFIT